MGNVISPGCLCPFQKKDGDKFACGKCPKCRQRRSSQWGFRLHQQSKVAMSAFFVTLTYNDDHVPKSPSGLLTLDKTAVPRFMKRLRKLTDSKLKYYAVGEYGSKFWRPHYHMILFNATPDQINLAWTLGYKPIGITDIQPLNAATVAYVLKYLSKLPLTKFRLRDRVPEFSLMSKGLGLNYITEAIRRYHKADLLNRTCCVLPGGIKVSMPRYYKDKLYTVEEREDIAAHGQLQASMMMPDVDENSDVYETVDKWRQAVTAAFEHMYNRSKQNRKL